MHGFKINSFASVFFHTKNLKSSPYIEFKIIFGQVIILFSIHIFTPQTTIQITFKMEIIQNSLSRTHQSVYYTGCYEQKDPL